MEKVKNKIMYQATNWDYKVGQKINFGKTRNYQAVRALNKQILMQNGEPAVMFLLNKIKENKPISSNELKEINEAMLDYSYCLREIGMEYCRKQYYPDRPSRFTCMFLCEKEEDAKKYLSTAKAKNNNAEPKVVKVKLNGKLFKTTNKYNRRDLSFDGFVENAHNYWKGVDENFNDDSTEFLFEGTAEIVEIIK